MRTVRACVLLWNLHCPLRSSAPLLASLRSLCTSKHVRTDLVIEMISRLDSRSNELLHTGGSSSDRGSESSASDSNEDDVEEALAETPIVEELERCRRLVTSMRSLVVASSARHQVLHEVEAAASARAQRQLADALAKRPDRRSMSPRERYVT